MQRNWDLLLKIKSRRKEWDIFSVRFYLPIFKNHVMLWKCLKKLHYKKFTLINLLELFEPTIRFWLLKDHKLCVRVVCSAGGPLVSIIVRNPAYQILPTPRLFILDPLVLKSNIQQIGYGYLKVTFELSMTIKKFPLVNPFFWAEKLIFYNKLSWFW